MSASPPVTPLTAARSGGPTPPALDAAALATLRHADAAHHLHPFTHHDQMHATGTHLIVGGDGCHVVDAEGRRFYDGIAGLWCVNLGYGCRPIVDAIAEQMRALPYYCSFFNSTTEPAVRLAERLGRLAPAGLGRVFFTSSGSEANETAMKLARGYHHASGAPSRTDFVARRFAYHGVGLASTSLTGLDSCLDPFGLPLPGFHHVPTPYPIGDDDPERRAWPIDRYAAWCIDQTRTRLDAIGPERIAAFFAEPVQGAGGVIVPPPGYLADLRQLCRERGILFVADEVITAYGRLGGWTASDMWSLEPDLITTAKGLSSGYLPIGAVFVADAVADRLHEAGYLAHGFTYSGHPAACAAALANLDELDRLAVLPAVRDRLGPHFQRRLCGLGDHPGVAEVRGVGLLGGVEFRSPAPDLRPSDPAGWRGPAVASAMRDRGFIVRGIRNLVALSPPLVTTETEIDQLFDALHATLDAMPPS